MTEDPTAMSTDPADVWATAQGKPTARPAGYLCYVDGDAVGFDARLALPRICLRCGGVGNLQARRRVVRLESDLATRLAMALQGVERSDLRVRPGDRLELVLPVCAACVAAQRLTSTLRWIVRTAPAWWLALVLVAAAVSSSLGGPLAVGLIPVIALLALWAYVRRGRTDLVLERIDSDGTVRLRGVHPDAAEAIQLASANVASP